MSRVSYSDNIIKYVAHFMLVYASLLIITSFIPFETGSGMAIALVMVGVYWASHKFITQQGCSPDKGERRKLALGCVLASYLVLIAYALFVVVYNNKTADLITFLSQPEAWFWGTVGLVFITPVYYLIMGLFFRVFSKILMRKMKV